VGPIDQRHRARGRGAAAALGGPAWAGRPAGSAVRRWAAKLGGLRGLRGWWWVGLQRGLGLEGVKGLRGKGKGFWDFRKKAPSK
jgi:hypothetical protein